MDYRKAEVRINGKLQTIDIKYKSIPKEILRELAIVCTVGEITHGKGEWKSNHKTLEIYDKMLGHASHWLHGIKKDADNNQHPLSSVIFRAAQLMVYERDHPELDNRPKVK